jgi:hypothetical protein
MRDSTGINASSYAAYTSSKRQNYRELKLSIFWVGGRHRLVKYRIDEASPERASGRSDQLDLRF